MRPDALARRVWRLHHAVRLTACAALPRIRIDAALGNPRQGGNAVVSFPTHEHFVARGRWPMEHKR